ncbi:helix-turn-helix transcriptional regulator [Enterobacter mori]|uniref:helix-turn-helix transcriptional regulator n=1 Tax=Enterobacter mori TaxID=539813 RepID=UPI00398AC5B1
MFISTVRGIKIVSDNRYLIKGLEEILNLNNVINDYYIITTRSNIIIFKRSANFFSFKSFIMEVFAVKSLTTSVESLRNELSHFIGQCSSFHCSDPPAVKLSIKEMYILCKLQDGISCSTLSKILGVNKSTISRHKVSALKKLSVHNIFELALAYRKWLVTAPLIKRKR